jgi:uncharacterized protein (DUF302 family)
LKAGIIYIFTLSMCLLVSSMAQADDLIMARSSQTFPEAMLTLQSTIKEYGYTVSRVQRVDIGLTKSGFQTDKYRIVFFGKKQEYDEMLDVQPDMMAYLPLKIVIYAEDKETILLTTNPQFLGQIFKDEKLSVTFSRWENDIRSMFDDMRAVQ